LLSARSCGGWFNDSCHFKVVDRDIGRSGSTIDIQPNLVEIRAAGVHVVAELPPQHPQLAFEFEGKVYNPQSLPDSDLRVGRAADEDGGGLPRSRIDDPRKRHASEDLQAGPVGLNPNAGGKFCGKERERD
jgi:hypothetical protein